MQEVTWSLFVLPTDEPHRIDPWFQPLPFTTRFGVGPLVSKSISSPPKTTYPNHPIFSEHRNRPNGALRGPGFIRPYPWS